ncbi:MAG: toprim domain-containing protein [Acetobacteraceae bacterium]
MTNDLGLIRQALIDDWQHLLLDLLGAPTRKGSRQWRWNRRGSLSAEIAGAKMGQWYDHEAGLGGGPFELIARVRGGDWRTAADWARAWVGQGSRRDRPPSLRPRPANDPLRDAMLLRRARARHVAGEVWRRTLPADPHHPYLASKRVGPHGLRQDRNGDLIVPLGDLDGMIHTIQRINVKGDKFYLPDGAKGGHFASIGPPLEQAATILLCEGWATGATAHEATGHAVVAAMDAGNLMQVALQVRDRFPAAVLTILADNDTKPGRDTNPGVTAATAAARATQARLAIPPAPGDMNDLAASAGLAAVMMCIDAATAFSPAPPTYALPRLPPTAARAEMEQQLNAYMTAVSTYWSTTATGSGP